MLLFFSAAHRPDRRRRRDSDRRPAAGSPAVSGAFGVGAMTIQTESDGARRATTTRCCAAGATSCSNSDIGAIFLSRQSTGRVDRSQQRRRRRRELPVHRSALSINGFLAKSATPGVDGGEMAGKGSVVVERQLRPHAVFAAQRRRQLSRRHRVHQAAPASASTSPTSASGSGPRWLRKIGIRELHPHTRYNIYTDQSNAKVIAHEPRRRWHGSSRRGGYLEVQWNPRFERIVTPFKIRPDQSFAPGSYGWNEYAIRARDQSQPEQSRCRR